MQGLNPLYFYDKHLHFRVNTEFFLVVARKRNNMKTLLLKGLDVVDVIDVIDLVDVVVISVIGVVGVVDGG